MYRNGILPRRIGTAYFRSRLRIAYDFEIRKDCTRTVEISCAYAGSGKVFSDNRYGDLIARIAYTCTRNRNFRNDGVAIELYICGFRIFFAVKIKCNRKDAAFGRQRNRGIELRCSPDIRRDRYRTRAYFLPL